MSVFGSSSALAGGKSVVELFTSQGCSSCPPADKLIGRLAQEPNLIALTLAVDYWDYLGWKDTLALAEHTQRQRNYAKTRGDMNVYTPQAIVNGVKYTVGSDASAVSAALRNHATNEPPMALRVKRAGDRLSVEISEGQKQGEATVWLLAVKSRVDVKITRGENKGETVSYFNVVRAWRNLGAYTGAPLRTSVAIAELKQDGADAVVVFVQNGVAASPGVIRNAEMIPLR